MQSIGRIFLSGLAVLLPAALTFAVLYWMVSSAEQWSLSLFTLFFEKDAYVPGLGTVGLLALIFGVGLLSRAWLFRKLFQGFETLLNRIPLIKTVYGSVKDFFDYFAPSKAEKKFNQAVILDWDQPEMNLLGLITKEDLQTLRDNSAEGSLGENAEDKVAVYLPMSYQIGGYMVLIERSKLKPLNMGFEDALRFIFTAGVSTSK